jgi:hypothetical protein
MSKTENECKTAFCTDLRNSGGYGRRLEDQYGVGIADMLCVPRGGPVFFIEAKIIRSSTWGATPVQTKELRRFALSCGDHGYACELGFDPANKTMTIRQIDEDNPNHWWNYKFPYWNNMGAEHFLRGAHKLWEKVYGR